MANFPVETQLFDINIEGDDANLLMKNWLWATRELPGGTPTQSKTIINGDIYLADASSADIVVDTEEGAATDDLVTITGRMHDGALIRLRSADAARKITLKKNTGGGGVLLTKDVPLAPDTYVEIRKSGDNWALSKVNSASVDVVPASTTVAGIVKLNDTVTSTSITEAATANAVKTAYDKADTAQGTANTAQNTANTAVGKADAAQGAANTAQGTANAAQGTANSAIGAASGAMKTDMSNFEGVTRYLGNRIAFHTRYLGNNYISMETNYAPAYTGAPFCHMSVMTHSTLNRGEFFLTCNMAPRIPYKGVAFTVDVANNPFFADFSPAYSHITLGNPTDTGRWTAIYASSGNIYTSDARMKTIITEDIEALIRAWSKIDFKLYQMNDAIEEKGSDKARIHAGIIAQQIKDSFEAEGLDPFRYGLLCYDEWEAKDEETQEYTDENGETKTRVIAPAREAGNCYSLRYEECLCLEAMYQRWRADKMESTLHDAQSKLESIESRLSLLENK